MTAQEWHKEFAKEVETIKESRIEVVKRSWDKNKKTTSLNFEDFRLAAIEFKTKHKDCKLTAHELLREYVRTSKSC